MKRWFPAAVESGYRGGRPSVGDAVAYDMRAWVVVHVADSELSVEEEASMLRVGWTGEARERRLPYTMTLRRLHGPTDDRENDRQEIYLRVPAQSDYHLDRYDEGRVPLCSCCGHPWPCAVTEAKAEAKEQADRLNAKMDRAGPGQCYSCGEAITHRQGSVTYPEPNVELLGYPAPRFHTRRSCRDGWYHYELKRAEVLPEAEAFYNTANRANA